MRVSAPLPAGLAGAGPRLGQRGAGDVGGYVSVARSREAATNRKPRRLVLAHAGWGEGAHDVRAPSPSSTAAASFFCRSWCCLCARSVRTWYLFCEAAAEETPALAMADEKPKVSLAPASSPRRAAGVTARAGVRPEPAAGSPRLPGPPTGLAAAQARALRAIFLPPLFLPPAPEEALLPSPAPGRLGVRAGRELGGRIGDARRPTGRERGFSAGRARVRRGVRARGVPTLRGPRAELRRVLPPPRWREFPPSGTSLLRDGSRGHLGTPARGRTGWVRVRDESMGWKPDEHQAVVRGRGVVDSGGVFPTSMVSVSRGGGWAGAFPWVPRALNLWRPCGVEKLEADVRAERLLKGLTF